MISFDYEDTKQTCPRQQSIMQQKIRNVFWPYTSHCIINQQLYFLISALTDRMSLLRPQNWSVVNHFPGLSDDSSSILKQLQLRVTCKNTFIAVKYESVDRFFQILLTPLPNWT